MENNFTTELSIRWSDMDANFHLRHSVYYDFGSQHRIQILNHFGLSLKTMQEQNFGPVIFREECVFKREIKLNDKINIASKLSRFKEDGSRWTITHDFLNESDKICAILTVEGAWLDIKERKLKIPVPDIVLEVFNNFPRTDHFMNT
jgi:acyl-CoA thioester hydrolase